MSKSASRVSITVIELTGKETFTELQELRQFLTNPPSEYLAERDKGSMVRAIANAKVLVGRDSSSGEIQAALVTYDHDGELVELGTLRVKEELEGYRIGPTLLALAIGKEVALEAPARVVALCKHDHPKIPKCLRDMGFEDFFPTPAVLQKLNHDVSYTSTRLFFDLKYHRLDIVANRLRALGEPPWDLPYRGDPETRRDKPESITMKLQLGFLNRGITISELENDVREKIRPYPSKEGIPERILRLIKPNRN